MEYFWWLYLATRLDSIREIFNAAAILGIFLMIGSLFVSAIILEGNMKATKSYRIASIVLIVIGAIGFALTPTKKDAMFIAGGVGVIEASKAIAGSEIAKKSVAIVEQWLTNELEAQKDKAKTKRDKD